MQCSLHYSIFDIPWWQQGQLYSEKVDMNEDEPEIVYIDCENENFYSQWWVPVQLYTQKIYLSALLIYTHPAGKNCTRSEALVQFFQHANWNKLTKQENVFYQIHSHI